MSESEMSKKTNVRMVGMLAAVLAFSFAWIAATESRSSGAGSVDSVEGLVTSTKGPEAGVWVIAETTDLPTKYAKIVVTDDQGRYALPELPTANYQVFVRGYGLVDSPKVKTERGKHLNLTAVPAPTAAAAAEY